MIQKVVVILVNQNEGIYYMKSTSTVRIICDEQNNKVGVIMSVKKFERLIEDFEDLQDLNVAYERTQKKEESIPFEQAMKELLGNGRK